MNPFDELKELTQDFIKVRKEKEEKIKEILSKWKENTSEFIGVKGLERAIICKAKGEYEDIYYYLKRKEGAIFVLEVSFFEHEDFRTADRVDLSTIPYEDLEAILENIEPTILDYIDKFNKLLNKKEE